MERRQTAVLKALLVVLQGQLQIHVSIRRWWRHLHHKLLVLNLQVKQGYMYLLPTWHVTCDMCAYWFCSDQPIACYVCSAVIHHLLKMQCCNASWGRNVARWNDSQRPRATSTTRASRSADHTAEEGWRPLSSLIDWLIDWLNSSLTACILGTV